MFLSLLNLCWWAISSREKRNFNQIFLFGQFFWPVSMVMVTKGIERIICMGPYWPKILIYHIDIIYLPTYRLESRLWDFLPIQGARIFHRGHFKDLQKIFKEFWSSRKSDYSIMSKMCQLKLEYLKFFTIFVVYRSVWMWDWSLWSTGVRIIAKGWRLAT